MLKAQQDSNLQKKIKNPRKWRDTKEIELKLKNVRFASVFTLL